MDRLRGLAVLLMVVDHLLIAVGEPSSWLRYTVTRAALPLFCLVAGALLQGRRANPHRVAEVAAVGFASWYLVKTTVLQPDICLLLALALVALPYLDNLPCMVLAVLQPVTWEIPWGGYQPGTVVVLLLLGRHISKTRLEAAGAFWPEFLGVIGRHPLAWYIGHLLLISALL